MRPSTQSPIGSIQKYHAWLPSIGQAAGECPYARGQCEQTFKYNNSTEWAGQEGPDRMKYMKWI